MPFYQINTNLPADKIPANFAKEASALVANTLGKPENVRFRSIFFEFSLNSTFC